jgi:ribosomal-protein-alanine N-acetyltransferase
MQTKFPIETDRLIIRHFTENDIEDDYRAASEPDMYKYMPIEGVTRESISELLHEIIENSRNFDPNNPKMLSFAVEIKNSREFIGWAAIGPGHIEAHEIMIGAGIAKKHRNKGYGAEACRAVMKFGFDILKTPEIVAFVKPENNPSIRMIEKLGMSFAGTVPPGSHENSYFDGVYKYKICKADFNSL